VDRPYQLHGRSQQLGCQCVRSLVLIELDALRMMLEPVGRQCRHSFPQELEARDGCLCLVIRGCHWRYCPDRSLDASMSAPAAVCRPGSSLTASSKEDTAWL